jgi:hypothetical protein
MQLRLERTDERLTRRSGLVLIDRFGKRLDIAKRIDSVFPPPGSNRGFLPSVYVTTLIEMMIDGATCLEDVRAFRDDAAYQAMTNRDHYPTSDALGDWLRRHGEYGGAGRIGQINGELVRTMTVERDLTLDIDTTLIASDKGDAEVCYEGFRAYNPLVGICVDLGLFVAARFQQGNVSPQSDLHSFIEQCTTVLPYRIGTVRVDSAGYNHDVMNFCSQHQLRFTITADHDNAVMAAIAAIAKKAWKQGVASDGSPASYEVAEALHTMNQTQESFRLVVKRTERYNQLDLFEAYHYWIVATNIPHSDMNASAIINFHNDRGEMERLIGELKHHLHLNHLPCGQCSANSLYFSIGVLAFNLVQLLKRVHFGQQWKTRSISSLRYLWLHAPAKLISHARSLVARIALAKDLFDELNAAYLHIIHAPASG